MDIVNFDYLIKAERILSYKDVNLLEDYIIVGKHDPRRREFKATDYPVWAAKASDVFGYNEMQDEGVPLLHRQILDFKGSNVQLTDDPINKKTIVTILPGSGCTRPTYQVLDNSVATTFNITTTDCETYVSFTNALSGPINFTATTTSTQKGDKLIIATEINPLSLGVTMTFNSSYYMWFCGALQTVITLTGRTKTVTTFIYDGQKWCNTYDNC